jgi:hypothetical protein
MNARFQNAQASAWMGIVGQEEENLGIKWSLLNLF